MEDVLAFYLQQLLLAPQFGDADGAQLVLHGWAVTDRVDALADGPADAVVVHADAAVGQQQEGAGQEAADQGVHVHQEVAVKIGQFGRHNCPDAVRIVINAQAVKHNFQGGGGERDGKGQPECPLHEGEGAAEHDQEHHHGHHKQMYAQEKIEPGLGRLHQVL